MSTVLMPSVAGLFYPEEAQELQATVQSFLKQAQPQLQKAPKALIAPHAGYIYSGPIAASAYAQLKPFADQIHRIAVFAPAHRLPFYGMATTSADYLRTPLGDVPVDQALREKALQVDQVQILDQAFAGEHALEVQLPFLQTVLADFTILPIIVGQTRSPSVHHLIEAIWSDTDLFVISSDLSHYLDYDRARQKDALTDQKIKQLRAEDLEFDDACGRLAIGGLLLSARNRGLRAQSLDLRNSGDTAGDKKRVVGYGAYVFQ